MRRPLRAFPAAERAIPPVLHPAHVKQKRKVCQNMYSPTASSCLRCWACRLPRFLIETFLILIPILSSSSFSHFSYFSRQFEPFFLKILFLNSGQLLYGITSSVVPPGFRHPVINTAFVRWLKQCRQVWRRCRKHSQYVRRAEPRQQVDAISLILHHGAHTKPRTRGRRGVSSNR